MRYCELFAGVGGFRLGIQQAFHAGAPRLESDLPVCVFANEWDKFACQTYNKNFEGTIDARDITTIPSADIPPHDLLVGGFPCQAFSVAGKRAGFDDTRGTLFFEVARILRDKRPSYFVLENVKGLLSHDSGRTFQTILGVLTDLGYGVQWQILNSKDFGVPQSRERIYLVGHFRNRPRPEVFPIIGNGGKTAKELTQNTSDALRIYNTDGAGRTLKSLGGGLGAKTGLYEVRGVAIRTRAYRGDDARLEYRRDAVANTVNSVEKDSMAAIGIRIRRLTPVECERLQGFPDGWTEGVSDTQRYKQMGNAVTVNVVTAVIRRIFNG